MDIGSIKWRQEVDELGLELGPKHEGGIEINGATLAGVGAGMGISVE
jgi:hypothetical protein